MPLPMAQCIALPTGHSNRMALSHGIVPVGNRYALAIGVAFGYEYAFGSRHTLGQ